MKSIFIFFLLFIVHSYAHSYITTSNGSNIFYEYSKGRSTKYVLANNDYEDIRIDSNNDGVIDYWLVKKGLLQIESYFRENSLSEQYVRYVKDNETYEYKYTQKAGKLILASSRRRQHLNRATRGSTASCQNLLKDLKFQISEIDSKITPEYAKEVVTNDLISPDCKSLLNSREFQRLKLDLKNLLLQESGNIKTCLNSDAFRNSFKDSVDRDLTAEIILTKYELQQKRMVYDSKNFKPLFLCNPIDEKENVVAVTNESGSVSLSIRDGKSIANRDDLEHELLHRAGVYSEAGVDTIQSICKSINSNKDVYAIAENISQKQPIPLVGNASAAAEEVASRSTATLAEHATGLRGLASESNSTTPVQSAALDMTASIPKQMTIQQSETPTSSALSASINNPQPLSDSGALAALYSSDQQSAGLLKRANILMGTMSSPANAESKKLTNTLPSLNSQNLAKGEKVVKQIVLGKNEVQTFAETSTTSRPGESQKIIDGTKSNNSPVEGETPIPRNQNIGSSELPKARTPASIEGQISSIKSNTSAGARTSSGTQRSAGPSVSSEEVITFISRANYATAKEKLKDSSFTQQLSSQGITILDLNGNTYGAKKGSVIFLDEGNRFVRQK